VAVQCGQVANQARIFGLPGAARARRNTAYMTCTFLGGSAGSWLGVRAYSEFGWGGIAGLTALASAAALTRHLAHRRSTAGPASARPATAGPAAAQTAPRTGRADPAGTDPADRVSCP
jgi:predicted MFS family arabinose efflux permease